MFSVWHWLLRQTPDTLRPYEKRAKASLLTLWHVSILTFLSHPISFSSWKTSWQQPSVPSLVLSTLRIQCQPTSLLPWHSDECHH